MPSRTQVPTQIPSDIWEQICQIIPYIAIAVVDKHGNFLWTSNEYSKITGYSPSELKELTWRDITVNKDVGGDQASIDEILEGVRQNYYLTKEYIRKDGTNVLIDLYVHSYPIWTKDVVLLIAIARERSSEEIQIEKLERDLVLQRKEITALADEVKILQERDDAKKGFYKYISGTIWPWVLLACSFVAFVVQAVLTIIKIASG